jgi:hypothetical protein
MICSVSVGAANARREGRSTMHLIKNPILSSFQVLVVRLIYSRAI